MPNTDNEFLGNFTSVKELKTAYDSLLSEFTRKCQLIKKLEKNLADASNPNNIDDLLNDDKFIDNHICNNQFIKNKIIANYLSMLVNRPLSYDIPQAQGMGVVAFSAPPKTLAEAKALADKLLNN